MRGPPLQHQTISASAGSGKTYQLALRYIALLAQGVRPETIVALTFSRKAAGEIFARILKRLAEALADEKERRLLAGQLGRELSREACVGHLRDVIQAMPLLRIGTLDSFMAQITQTFSFELGLRGGFEILDGAPRAMAERDALKRTLAPGGRREDVGELHQAFKESTFGSEGKSVCRQIEQFIARYYETYLNAPGLESWGCAATIWPDGGRWMRGTPLSASELERVLAGLKEAGDHPQWAAFCELLGSFDGERFAGESTLLKQLLQQASCWEEGGGELTYRNKRLDVPGPARALLGKLVRHCLQSVLLAQLAKTRGIHRVLDRYDAIYHERVRRAGKITFQDIVHTLNGDALTPRRPMALSQHREQDRAESLLYINYRLDGRFDHWLLDEFQDTSNAQWQVLGNLIDEIMQVNDGSRTFFYVGDVKQAIYGWRGGDASLFNRVRDYYHPRIEERQLARSWRSAPAVIETVNRVFDSLRPNERLPGEAVEQWRAAWQAHETEKKELPGYAVFEEIPREKGQPAADTAARFERCAERLRELRGNASLSCAVLVRNNATGVEMADFLRAKQIPAIWEGDSLLEDNTVVSALLALIRLAEHPGDEFAWQQVNMTPLRGCLETCRLTRHTLPALLLRQIHQVGFHGTLRHWMELVSRMQPEPFSAFSVMRLEQLLREALVFDQTRLRNVDSFAEFVRQAASAGVETPGYVRVMTFHKAKGLEFDAVILPDLQTDSLDSLGPGGIGLVTHMQCKGAYARPDWVLLYPAAAFHEADPVLDEQARQRRIESAYEALCTLYVAMTRARQGLYMIATAPARNASAFYAADLLRAQLAPDGGENIRYEAGRADWHRVEFAADSGSAPPAPVALATPRPGRAPPARLERHVPSDEADRLVEAEQLFAAAGRAAAEFGTALHALFEQVEWYGSGQEDRWIDAWRERFPIQPQVAADVEAAFRGALASPAVQQALARPDEFALAWREQRFEMALDKRWISGCFDRVVISRDRDGRPRAAVIMDYKSNRINQESDLLHALGKYRPQMLLYREVLSALLDLPREKIGLQLVFTHPGRVGIIEP